VDTKSERIVTALPDDTKILNPDPVDLRTFRDCPMCPEMVEIRPGEFRMGSEFGPDIEKPVHWVTVPRPIAVGQTEVTVVQWQACAREGSCVATPGRDSDASFPVTGVNRNEAQSYVNWLSLKTNRKYRLPSEAEWEYLARGGEGLKFPTGSIVSSNSANYDGLHNGPLPVGSYPANGYGIFDLAGNVWEWVSDCAHSYTTSSKSGTFEPEQCRGVLRGGGWQSKTSELLAANRFFYPHDQSRPDFGFRVARDTNP